MYIERKLEKKIQNYMNTPEIIAIVGPRQSGKTTLMQKIFSNLDNAKFISFEDIHSFIELYIRPYRFICIDEFQYSRTGGQRLKYIYDTSKDKKIFIIGSSSIDLTVKTLGYLVGRIFIFELFPLSFEEFLHHREKSLLDFLKEKFDGILQEGMHDAIKEKLIHLMNEFLLHGGFPRAIRSSNVEEKQEVLKNLAYTFMMRDIKEILNVQNEYKFDKLLKALSFQVGNIISYNELSKVTELSFKTLKSYLNTLEKTYIIKLISPFYKNNRKFRLH